MKRKALGMLVLALASAACGSSAEPFDPAVLRAMERIEPEPIEAHMRRLADDAMEGRATATRGYLMAADYVARRFEELGLRPAGDDEGYFQSVPLRSTELLGDKSSIALLRNGKTLPLEIDADFTVRGDFIRERAELTAPVVFVGFGVVAPNHQYDDYAGVDVRGKIAAFFRGAPAWMPHDERAYYSSRGLKYHHAVKRGAVGVLEMLLPADRRGAPWERSVRQSKLPSMRWIDRRGMPHDAFPELFVVARLSEQGERALFEEAPKRRDEAIEAAESGYPEAFELPGKLAVKTASRLRKVESPNVIGLLPGSDPRLREEYVVLTAHLDHVGVGEPVNGDAIHNGAYDNASGIAILLEMARAFADLPRPPRRSLLFLAVTGEEKGLLGSDFFLDHATVPLDGIVANVNLDMVLMLHPLLDVVAFGAEHSSLSAAVERATSRLGIRLSPDPIPEEVLFIRSDQFPFVQRGIPAIFVVSGLETPDPSVDGKELLQEWMRTIYHSPADDMDQQIDFEAGAKFARVNFLASYLVASDEERPSWNPGDFFGELFGR